MTKYSTTDIYLASTIIASGFPLSKITKKEKQYSFCFEYSVPIDIIVSHYWNGTLQVSAKYLFNSFKELKTRMYNP